MAASTNSKASGFAKPKRNPPEGYGSIRAYAEHRARRGLDGKTHTAVIKAIKEGRIRPPNPSNGWLTFAEADAQWQDNTRAVATSTQPIGVDTPPEDLPIGPDGHPDFNVLPPIHRWRVKLDYLKSLQLIDELRLRQGELYEAEAVETLVASLAQTLLNNVTNAVEGRRGATPAGSPTRKLLDELAGEMHAIFSAATDALEAFANRRATAAMLPPGQTS